MDANPTCEDAGYNNGTAGNIICGIYLGVQCDQSEQQCAYKIKLTAYDDAEGEQIAYKDMPRYITWNHDYIQGSVAYRKSQYFYLPIDPETIGSFAILVNKTSPFGSDNGDVNVSSIIHPGAGLRYYQNWVQPSGEKHMGFSRNGHSTQPEIIEYCEEAITSWCSFKNYPDCTLMFKVSGMSADLTSFFRIKVFNGTNKLEPGKPVAANLENKGDMQYFWFVSTAALNKNTAEWGYDIALGIQSLNSDADLYVTVMDGRYPTE